MKPLKIRSRFIQLPDSVAVTRSYTISPPPGGGVFRIDGIMCRFAQTGVGVDAPLIHFGAPAPVITPLWRVGPIGLNSVLAAQGLNVLAGIGAGYSISKHQEDGGTFSAENFLGAPLPDTWWSAEITIEFVPASANISVLLPTVFWTEQL